MINHSVLFRHRSSLLLLLLFSLPGFSQQAKQFAFKHFSVVNGLVSNTVKSVVQDKDGFIWIGTYSGLQRFDGGNFISFKASKKNARSLPSDRINILYSDRKNNLWVVMDYNTTGIFDTKSYTFQPVEIPNKEQHAGP